MAKVKNPLLSTQASGMASGMIYSHTRGQDVARRYLRPTRRFRSTQPNNRSILGFLSRQWSTLSAGARQAWRDYADEHTVANKFGEMITLTGANCYVKLLHTTIRLFTYAALYTDPPLVDPPATVLTLVAEAGGAPGEIDLTWTLAGTPVAGDKIEVQIAGPFGSVAIEAVENRWKYLTKETGVTLVATLGGLTEGAWYWIRVRYVDATGQVTNWVRDQATPAVTP